MTHKFRDLKAWLVGSLRQNPPEDASLEGARWMDSRNFFATLNIYPLSCEPEALQYKLTASLCLFYSVKCRAKLLRKAIDVFEIAVRPIASIGCLSGSS